MVNYICIVCNKNFNRKSSYLNHTEKKKYSCTIKNIVFENQIRQPVAVPIQPVAVAAQREFKKYKCNLCEYVTTRIDNYKRHLSSCEMHNQKMNKEAEMKKQEDVIKQLSDEIKNILATNAKYFNK